MSMVYAVKHVFRSWPLFIALLLGILLASAFFAGIDIKANVTTEKALDEQLRTVYKDFEIQSSSFDLNQLNVIQDQLAGMDKVQGYELISRGQGPSAVVGKETQQTTPNLPREIYTMVVGITANSRVYDGWSNKPAGGLAANETYISRNANFRYGSSEVNVGDVVQMNFTMFNSQNGSTTILPLNLTVAGYAELDDGAYSIVSGSTFYVSPSIGGGSSGQFQMPPFFGEPYIVDWEKTVKPFLQATNDSENMPFMQSFIVYIDRKSVISAWDIPGSITNLQVLQNNIANKLDTALGSQVSLQNNLMYQVQSFQGYSIGLRLNFLLISIPIFFMAWYMGTTVSEVSFTSRRREIGLLATKGFSTGQISRIFLFETILIGTIGSLLGVLLGFALAPLFAASSAVGLQFNLATLNPYTVVFTVAFGLIMAFLSTYASSKRAAKLSTVGALREYLPVEPQQSYRKRIAWLCLILGTYKIVVYIAGINVQTLVSRAVMGGGNFILTLLGGIWVLIDMGLSYVGPLLFFYGFAKLFIQGSLKFQELTVRASKFLGDIGTLATKNVRRKPARTAAMAFLIALIVWYGVLVTGQLAIERDYSTRSVYASVGADVTAEVANVSQTQAILQNVLANVSGIKDASAEYSINAQGGSMQLKAVDPDLWLKTAYYEPGWFSGSTVDEAFAAMKADNDTIILDQGQAKNLNVGMGESVSVRFENDTKALRVVGLFGPKPSDSTPSIGVSLYYSFVPYNLYAYPGNLTSASARILAKLDGSLDGQAVADDVRNVDGIITVNSVSKSLELAQTNVLSTGTLEVQQLGIVFAVLAASVGTALISVVSMRERAREATIMSVRGLSYKQLVIMFLTESFALVTLSIVLGAAIGFISVYGNMSSANAQGYGLVLRQFVFPLDSTLLIVGCVALIFAATVLPVIIMSRKYVTQLEKMVRSR